MKRSRNSRKVYELSGEALDQETIVRLRPQIEQYVREDMGKKFSKTNLIWNMNEKKNFTFKIDFYA
jgi:hypothetical protein